MNDSKITFSAYTKLMENTKLPTDIKNLHSENLTSAPKSFSVCLNKNNLPVIVIAFENGSLICMRKDSSGDVDFLSDTLLGTADSTALRLGVDKCLYLFLLRNGKVFLRKEKEGGSGVFGEETTLNMSSSNGLAKSILIKSLPTGLLTGVVCLENKVKTRLDYAVIKTGTESFTTLTEPFEATDTTTFTWMGTDEESAKLCVVGTKYAEYRLKDKIKTSYTGSIGEVAQLKWSPWITAEGLLLSRTPLGEIFEIKRDITNKTVIAKKLVEGTSATGISFCAISTDSGYRGDLLTCGKQSCHISLIQRQSESLNASDFVPLESESSDVCMQSNDGFSMESYLLFSESRCVVQLCRSISGDYTRKEISLPTLSNKEKLNKLPCFSTELTLTDNNKVPLTYKSVTLTASDAVYVDTPNGPCRVSPKEAVTLKTDAMGRLMLMQDTDGFACGVLNISLTQNNEVATLQIRQSEPVYQRFSKITPKDFAEAKKHDKEFLLPFAYRTEAQAKKLLTPIKNMMDIVPLKTKTDAMGVVCNETVSALTDIPTLPKDATPCCWRVCFDTNVDDTLTYEALDEKTVLKRIQELKDCNFLPFSSSIGDICYCSSRSFLVINEIIQYGYDTMIRFVINGVEYLISKTLKTVRQVLDLCLAIFKRIGVLFRDLFEWIGFILDWNDILRYQKAIATFFPLSITHLRSKAQGVRNHVEEYSREIRAKTRQTITSMKAQFVGKTVHGYILENTPEDKSNEHAISNDILQHKMMVKSEDWNLALQLPAINTSAGERIYETISTFLNDKENMPEAKDLIAYGKDAFSKSNSMAGSLFGAVLDKLEYVMGVALSGSERYAKAVLGEVDSIADYLMIYLSNQMQIPFFTRLWKIISGGQPLTILNLVALIIAVPSTIMFKLIFGRSPIKNDDELKAFEQDITVFFTKSEFGYVNIPKLKTNSRELLRTASAISCLVNYALLATIDAMNDEEMVGIEFFTYVSLCTESLWTVLGFPYLYSDDTSSSLGIWLYSVLGLASDWGISVFFSKHVDHIKRGKIFTCTYGVIHLIIVAIFMKCDISKTAAICQSFAEMLKPLTLLDYPAKYVNVFFNLFSAVLGFSGDISSLLSESEKEE